MLLLEHHSTCLCEDPLLLDPNASEIFLDLGYFPSRKFNRSPVEKCKRLVSSLFLFVSQSSFKSN